MKKVIAFLGTFPRETTYDIDGVHCTGFSFPEALSHSNVPFDRMLVFVTDKARAQNYDTYVAPLADKRIQPIDIPDGRNSAEMWDIFTKLTSVVEDGDTVIFDITHAFRSIPFFVFLALAFLKSAARDVHIERVIYGAPEFGQPAPVIELTEFVGLLDWMSATDQFVRNGNSQALVRELREAAQSTRGTATESRRLSSIASSLDDVSRALRLLIPDQAMSAGAQLHQELQAVNLPSYPSVRPFLPLIPRVDEAFAELALAHPRDPRAIWQSLEQERRMVFWYLERQLLLQAIALAFEWLISFGVAHLGYETLFNGPIRTKVREHYTKLNQFRKGDRRPTMARIREAEEAMRAIPESEQILRLFERVSHLRNDLMHASKTAHSGRTPDQREREIRAACRELERLPLRVER
jgi:CRISPR-associated Csx2 family protein